MCRLMRYGLALVEEASRRMWVPKSIMPRLKQRQQAVGPQQASNGAPCAGPLPRQQFLGTKIECALAFGPLLHPMFPCVAALAAWLRFCTVTMSLSPMHV